MNNISSPCVNICKIDPHTEICVGCKRSVEEIEDWLMYEEIKRREIMRKLKDK